MRDERTCIVHIQRCSSASSSKTEENPSMDLTPEQQNAMSRAATCIQSRYRGYAVRKAYKMYKIGGVVSELLYSPSSGERPPKDQPKPRGRINAHVGHLAIYSLLALK